MKAMIAKAVAITARGSKSKTPAEPPRTSKIQSTFGFDAMHWSDAGEDMPQLGKRTKSSVALTDKRPKKMMKTYNGPAFGLCLDDDEKP